MMLKAIDRRIHNEYAIEASLHGLRVPMRNNMEALVEEEKAEDVSFDKKIVERAMHSAQRRVKSRYV